MDLPLARAALDFSRRRRRWILLLAATGLTSYGAYKAYHHPSVADKRRKLAKLLRSLISVAEALTASAEAASLVSADLSRFLRSNSNELPSSLKQVAKLARSEEVSGSLSRVSEAVTVGMLRGAQSGSDSESSADELGLPDRILDKVFSPAGTGFVSVVAGSFAKSLVTGLYASEAGQVADGELPEWARVACSDKVRQLMGDCIQKFVSTAVSEYLDKTMEINTYDEMFSGLTNPKHEGKMKDVLVSVCNGAMETLVKTSHEVLTSSRPSSASVAGAEYVEPEVELPLKQVARRPPPGDKSCNSIGGGGWVDGVSSTLAVPNNRSFVLDVTGRVTFETVRSFLDFSVWKMCDTAKSGVNVVRQEVIERGLEVVRYANTKSMLILTVCLSMLLHWVFRSQFLLKA